MWNFLIVINLNFLKLTAFHEPIILLCNKLLPFRSDFSESYPPVMLLCFMNAPYLQMCLTNAVLCIFKRIAKNVCLVSERISYNFIQRYFHGKRRHYNNKNEGRKCIKIQDRKMKGCIWYSITTLPSFTPKNMFPFCC